MDSFFLDCVALRTPNQQTRKLGKHDHHDHPGLSHPTHIAKDEVPGGGNKQNEY